jgi:hypothetical protein
MEFTLIEDGDVAPVTIKKGTKLRVKVMSTWTATTSAVRAAGAAAAAGVGGGGGGGRVRLCGG